MFLLMILAVFASDKTPKDNPEYQEKVGNNEENVILVKIEEDEYDKMNKKSEYIGVCYHKQTSKWRAQRRSKNENINRYYDNEETAAHASDALARKIMKNGKQKLKLNFYDDYTKIHREHRRSTSKYFGVSYKKERLKWRVQRWRKNGNTMASNGYYDDEVTAAHASDTLARKLMENGEQKLELNFPDDYSSVYTKGKQTNSEYIGVIYNKKNSNWNVRRWCKHKKKYISNGSYEDKETAARASDTLARKLMDNGEEDHKLNFPDENSEQNNKKKRKRSDNLDLEQPHNN